MKRMRQIAVCIVENVVGGGQCNHINGTCMHGYETGYNGSECTESSCFIFCNY